MKKAEHQRINAFELWHWRRLLRVPWMTRRSKQAIKKEIKSMQEIVSKEIKTERLHFDFSLACVGEGNGNPLQCSCLENLRDGGAWWAAIYGVSQSRTRLKQLSSSSKSKLSILREINPEYSLEGLMLKLKPRYFGYLM